mgnify:CR=1 FL=1
MFREDLLLTNATGKRLYERYAKDLPVIDYHCHLLPGEIYENREFEDIGEMWLAHDHYKWRAMRCFGIPERYITGDATYYEKYLKFAEILPELVGNPLYIWCALELKRYFDIEEALNRDNAAEIYRRCKEKIVKCHMTPLYCMKVSRVELACTTEDPTDTLIYHRKMQEQGTEGIRIISAFRPDKAFYAEKPGFAQYMKRLSDAAGMPVGSFREMMAALESRLKFFRETGSMISDNGIEDFTWQDYTAEEIEAIFARAAAGEALDTAEINGYRSAFLTEAGRMYHRNGFVMQLHIGTYQGANRSREADIGAACGFDCTDDSTFVKSVGKLLDRLNSEEALPKTILYPLNAGQMENFAILAAGFCEGPERGKVQLGAPWWFNDQAYGIKRQFEAAANLYPVALSVGMLTDSRSFISYPRHELYRRVLCNYFGELVERGEYISGEEELARVIRNVCHDNARNYFGL